MKIAIFFYSKTGNTKHIAKKIKELVENQKHTVHLIDIKPEKQPGFLKAGYSAIRQKTLPITNDVVDVSSFNLVFVGCPVWAGKPAPFIRTMIQKINGLEHMKTSVFITCAGGESPESKAVGLVESYLKEKNATVIDESLIVHMTRKKEIRKEIPPINTFINNIIALV